MPGVKCYGTFSMCDGFTDEVRKVGCGKANDSEA